MKQLIVTFSERDDIDARPSAGERTVLEANDWVKARSATILQMTTNVTSTSAWEDYTLTLLVEIEVQA